MPIHVSVGGLEKGENTFLSIFKQFPIRLQCVGTGTARNPLIDLLTDFKLNPAMVVEMTSH